MVSLVFLYKSGIHKMRFVEEGDWDGEKKRIQ